MKALVVLLLIAGHAIGCRSQSGYDADVAGSAGYPQHFPSSDEQKRQTEEHYRRNLEPDDCED